MLELDVAHRRPEVPAGRKEQKFSVAVAQEPSTVVLDPDVWVLMDAKFTRR